MTRALRPIAAAILRTHFDTEASDAGLKSLDLASTGGQGSRSYDMAAVARADRSKKRGNDNTHQRINESLRHLSPSHVEILSLAYGVRLRSIDTYGKKRRAVRSDERNWRVRLAELYGQEGAVVLALPLVQQLFSDHVWSLRKERSTARGFANVVINVNGQTIATNAILVTDLECVTEAVRAAQAGGVIPWLLDLGKTYVAAIIADAKKALDEALDTFVVAHGITEAPHVPRQRSNEKTRARVLAFHAEHGVEIG